jgi:hypothetical protein
MDNIIALIIVFAFGWFLGSRLQYILDRITFKSILDDLGVTGKQLRDLAERGELAVLNDLDDVPAVNANTLDGDRLTPLEITLEQHQGVIYAYRKDTQQFLGQGTDQQGLIDSISKRMTDVRLIIDQQDGADLLRKNNT